MGNMAALFAFRFNGSHLGRFAVAAVFLSFSVSWASCNMVSGMTGLQGANYCTSSTINKDYPSCNSSFNQSFSKSCTSSGCTANVTANFRGGSGGWLYCTVVGDGFTGCNGFRPNSDFWVVTCTTQSEADSVACVNEGNVWQNGLCQPPCDAECQCQESGGTWVASNGGYCVPKCESQFCCDSLNQTLPPQIDTTWQGCVATDPSNDKCVVLPTVANNTGSTSAECTAKSRYLICTSSYVWNRTANQCAPISTNNCINQDVANDPRCTKVLCEAYQTRSVSALQYNGRTECYEGLQLVQDMMVCDNGIREERSRSTEAFQVCDSYLEANNITIQDYLSGQNGGYASVGGSSAGPGGGSVGTGGGSTSEGGCVGNGCNTGVFDGGTSVNAQGDTVQNSASPNIGGVWTPQQQLVTQVDSATGTVTVVQNSQGGDSVRTSVTPSGVRCIGISGGVATLTNGYSTWTCSNVQSCSQAVISASINGGRCSAGSNGVVTDNYNSDRMPLILDSNGNAILTSETDNLERAMQQLASVMNGIANKDTLNRQKVHQIDRNHQDSLWKATFGDGLDAVRNMEHYIASASSANSAAIASAASQITSANSHALSANSQAISAMADNLSGKLTTLNNSVKSASSANSSAIASAASQITSANSQGFNSVASAVGDASASLGGKIDNLKNTYRDSVHASNGFLNGILNALDTGGIVNRDLNGIRDAVNGLPAQIGDVYAVSLDNWYDDKLKLTLDENAQKVADAIDSLHLEVKLDSIKIDMPKDSVVDSIYSQLKSRATIDPSFFAETLDLSGIMQKAYDSTQFDTSYVKDSSFSEHMKAVASQTTLEEDTYVDSVVAVMQSKLDSNRQAMNVRSDSAVKDFQDSVMKYTGVDSVGRALNNFFGGYSSSCPRQCLDITLNHVLMTKGQTSTVPLGYYICELQIIGTYTVIDFIKMIFRILTAWYCMSMMLQFMTVRQPVKGKK